MAILCIAVPHCGYELERLYATSNRKDQQKFNTTCAPNWALQKYIINYINLSNLKNILSLYKIYKKYTEHN